MAANRINSPHNLVQIRGCMPTHAIAKHLCDVMQQV